MNSSPSLKYHIFSFCLGSLLDLDHFISSQSFSLYKATHLDNNMKRPFGHALIFIFIISFIFVLVTRNIKIGIISFICLLSHQLRDSIRRGLWLWPLNTSTHPTPYFIYLFLLCILPLTIQWFFKQHLFIRMSSSYNYYSRKSYTSLLPTVV